MCHIPVIPYLDISPSCSESDTYCIEKELVYGLLTLPSHIFFLIPLPIILLNLSLTWINHPQDTICNNLRTTSSGMEFIAAANAKIST